MARSFIATSSQYLQVERPVITDYPFTMACWFKVASIPASRMLMYVGDKDSGRMWQGMFLEHDTAYPGRAYSRSESETSIAISTGSVTMNQWQHLCCVFPSSASRSAFVNGGNKGTNSTSVSISGLDRTCIGRFGDASPSGYFDGPIAEAAVWDAALTDAEVASLAAGFSPLLIRPANLVAYWPLVRDADIDIVGGYDLTAYNSPTVAAHCPIMRPTRPQVIVPSSGITIPALMQHYRKMRVA